MGELEIISKPIQSTQFQSTLHKAGDPELGRLCGGSLIPVVGRAREDPGFKNPFVISWASQSRVNPTANHRLTLDLWLAKDNRFLNPKSSYKRILMAPPCRLIQNQLTTIVVPVFDWQLILMESRPWSPGTWGCHHPFVGVLRARGGNAPQPRIGELVS